MSILASAALYLHSLAVSHSSLSHSRSAAPEVVVSSGRTTFCYRWVFLFFLVSYLNASLLYIFVFLDFVSWNYISVFDVMRWRNVVRMHSPVDSHSSLSHSRSAAPDVVASSGRTIVRERWVCLFFSLLVSSLNESLLSLFRFIGFHLIDHISLFDVMRWRHIC